MRMLTLIGLLVPSLVMAATPVNTLKNYLQDITSYQARFEQHIFDADGETLSTATGNFWVQRPGKFLWDQSKPEVIRLLADGQLFWSYDEMLDQVVVRTQDTALKDTPAAWLSHPQTQWLEQFEVSRGADEDCFSPQCFSLVSKEEHAPFQKIFLGFNDGMLSEILLEDWFDQETQILFSHGQLNTEISSDLFIFVPPEGADIIEAS